jgi:hypothetical protein
MAARTLRPLPRGANKGRRPSRLARPEGPGERLRVTDIEVIVAGVRCFNAVDRRFDYRVGTGFSPR